MLHAQNWVATIKKATKMNGLHWIEISLRLFTKTWFESQMELSWHASGLAKHECVIQTNIGHYCYAAYAHSREMSTPVDEWKMRLRLRTTMLSHNKSGRYTNCLKRIPRVTLLALRIGWRKNISYIFSATLLTAAPVCSGGLCPYRARLSMTKVNLSPKTVQWYSIQTSSAHLGILFSWCLTALCFQPTMKFSWGQWGHAEGQCHDPHYVWRNKLGTNCVSAKLPFYGLVLEYFLHGLIYREHLSHLTSFAVSAVLNMWCADEDTPGTWMHTRCWSSRDATLSACSHCCWQQPDFRRVRQLEVVNRATMELAVYSV